MAEAVKCPEVATKFGCGRTKTTIIIKSAIAPVLDSNVTALCKERPYLLMIDESNDRGGEKLLAILVCVFDDAVGTAVTRLIDIPACNVSTAAAIYEKIIECVAASRQLVVQPVERSRQCSAKHDCLPSHAAHYTC